MDRRQLDIAYFSGNTPMVMAAEIPIRTEQTIQQQVAPSSDARTMILFEANKKSAVVAYLLWGFLGWFGGHNFYLKRTGVAVAQMILTFTGVGFVITFSGSSLTRS
jgi:hypothetical protein